MSKKKGTKDTVNPHFIYPLNNYEFEYAEYVEQTMNPEKLGMSPDPNVSVLRTDLESMGKYVGYMINDPIPEDASTAYDGINKNDPIAVARYHCNEKQGKPYKRFDLDYPPHLYRTTGKYSSSYFIQNGFCPVSSATTEDECKARDRNYTWEGDKCYKPRYSYLNNASDSGILDGTLTSTIREIVDLNTYSFYRITQGKAIRPSREGNPPRFKMIECIPEEFTGDYTTDKSNLTTFILTTLLLLVIVYVFFTWKNA